MNWRLIPYSSAEPAWNMAADEAIFTSYLQNNAPPTLRFYGWDPPALSVGYFQEVAKEVNLFGLTEKGFGLVRRNTGGRAVLHNQELTYSVVAGTRDGIPDHLISSYLYISRALVEALKEYGIAADLHEGSAERLKGTGACFEAPSWYEITVAGRKLVGSAQLRRKNALLQHGSILLDFSPFDLGAVLNLNRLSLDEWAARMKQKVTSLRDLGVSTAPAELAEAIGRSFQKLYAIRFREDSLSPEELRLTERLVLEKYATPGWNLSRGSSHNQSRVLTG